MIVEWFYQENIESRTHCNAGGEIKQDLVEYKLLFTMVVVYVILSQFKHSFML